MAFKETHKMVFTEVAEVCQFPYGHGTLIMLLDKLQDHLQFVGNIGVGLVGFLVGYVAVQQEEQVKKLRFDLQFVAEWFFQECLPDRLKGFQQKRYHWVRGGKMHGEPDCSAGKRNEKTGRAEVRNRTFQHIQAKDEAVRDKFRLRLFHGAMEHFRRKEQKISLSNMVRLQINLIGAGALPYISDLKFFMPVYRQAAGAERKYTGIIL